MVCLTSIKRDAGVSRTPWIYGDPITISNLAAVLRSTIFQLEWTKCNTSHRNRCGPKKGYSELQSRLYAGLCIIALYQSNFTSISVIR